MKDMKIGWVLFLVVFGVVCAEAAEIILEVESGTVTPPMQVQQIMQASGGAAVVVPESEGVVLAVAQVRGSVTLTFDVETSGTYRLWGKVFTPGSPRTREDSFFLELDGKTYVWRIHDWADNWVWRRFLTEDRLSNITFDLSQGRHHLKLMHRVAGTYIDQLKLVSQDEEGVFSANPEDYVASDVEVYEDLCPYFDMPTLTVPQFPQCDFFITDFGAVGDGKTKNTEAFKRAIQTCFDAGGGRVVVPEGDWLTGPIHLKSFVNLHLAKGATIRFSQRFDDYLPVVFVRWEGIECYNYSPPIYGFGLRNVAITGHGVIDGQGEAWWPWHRRQRAAAEKLYQLVLKGVPPAERILGIEEMGMRPNFVQLISCQNILIENVTFKNGPMWTLNPVYCSDMIVRGIKVKTVGPNNDGVNPDSTRNLLIEDCYLSTGDDCMALKAGLNEEGWRVGRCTENIVIRRVYCHEGHGGVVIGSEMSGGIRNVYAHDCIMDGTDRGFRVKSMRGRGGVIENIWVEDIPMRNIGGQAVRLNMFYSSSTIRPATQTPAAFRHFTIRNIVCDGAATAVEITGLPELAIEDIVMENLVIKANEGIKIADGIDLEIRDLDLSTRKGPPLRLNRVRNSCFERVVIDSPSDTWVDIKGSQSQGLQLRGFQEKANRDQRVSSEPGAGAYIWE